MTKARDDLKELQRKLLVLAKLDGASVHLADGVFVIEASAVVDARALYRACIEGAGMPSLGAVIGALRVERPPLLVTPRLLATARRNLMTLTRAPSLLALVDEAPRLFRRHRFAHGIRAWIAGREAILNGLSSALAEHDAAATIAPWRRVLAFVEIVHGADAARILDGIREERLRDAPDREELDEVLGVFGMAFSPLPREAGPSENHGELSITKEDIALGRSKMRSALMSLGGQAITLGQVFALLDLVREGGPRDAALTDHRLAPVGRLVASGLTLSNLGSVLEHRQLEELLLLEEDPEAARSFARWVTTLAPHFHALGRPFPLTAAVMKNLRRMARRDLGLLAVCLLAQRHEAGDEERGPFGEAERALAALDTTMGLFHRYPGEATSILARLTDVKPGEGRAALPELAAWLEDDALVDRWVHLCRLADSPVALPSRLRRDFERDARVADERRHLQALTAPNAVQLRRLAALDAAEGTTTGTAWTRRHLSEAADELAARVYRIEQDRLFCRLIQRVWGIAVGQLSRAWRDALRFHFVVDKNRDLLREVLSLASERPGVDVAPRLPASRAWIAAASAKMNVDAWLAPRARPVAIAGKPHTLSVEHDALEIFRMGIPFDTCLSLDGGVNAAATVVNAAEANKRVLYMRNEAGNIVARKLVAISSDFALVGYRVYVAVSGMDEEASRHFDVFCREWAHECGIALAVAGAPARLHDGFWYDDGTQPWGDGLRSSRGASVADYCTLLGVAIPAAPTDELVDDARAFRAVMKRDAEAAAAVPSDLTPFACGAWLLETLGRRRCVEISRWSSRFASLCLAAVARHGVAAVMALAGEIAAWTLDVASWLGRFPVDATAAFALADAANASTRYAARFDDHGLEHQSMALLPRYAEEMPTARLFDLCDRIEPAWTWVAEKSHGACSDCRDSAALSLSSAAVSGYRKTPDPEAVIACLRSPRRSRVAHAVAIRIASAFTLAPLTQAARGLDRLAAKYEDLAEDATWIAARLRHAAPARAPSLRVDERKPELFDRLADLLVTRDLGELLAPLTRARSPFTTQRWQLYFLRRHATELRRALAAEAIARQGDTPAVEKLALLGDVETLRGLVTAAQRTGEQRREVMRSRAARTGSPKREDDAPLPITVNAAEKQLRIAEQIRAQIDAPAGCLPPRASGPNDVRSEHIDAATLLAAETLVRAAASRGRVDDAALDAALDVVFDANDADVTARALAMLVAMESPPKPARTFIARVIHYKTTMECSELTAHPEVLARVLQLAKGEHADELRPALAHALAKVQGEGSILLLLRAEETARALGLVHSDLVERWIHALLDHKQFLGVAAIEALAPLLEDDSLVRVMRAIVTHEVHASVLAVYRRFRPATCALFLRELGAAWSQQDIREAIKSDVWTAEDIMKRDWLEAIAT